MHVNDVWHAQQRRHELGKINVENLLRRIDGVGPNLSLAWRSSAGNQDGA
jgi:hypothetical protein